MGQSSSLTLLTKIGEASTATSPQIDPGGTEDGEILDISQQFHNTVRENIIFLLFFLTLSMISWSIIGIFIRKKEKEGEADDDESLVYRICFWLCVFSLSISMGATLLLPISILSNEVLILYPKSYYVQWLNGMLIQGIWNLIFLFSNISLFVLMPFAHLFMESEGFSGNKKGLAGKFYETVVVLVLSGFAIWGISHILATVLSPNERVMGGLFNYIGFSNQLPFIYSCISFFGVLLLLSCTPIGAGKLFTVLSQLLVGPQFLRNIDEEHRTKFLEILSLKNRLQKKIKNSKKIANSLLLYYETKNTENLRTENIQKGEIGNGHDLNKQLNELDIIALKKRWDKMSNGIEDDEDQLDADSILSCRDPEFVKMYHKMISVNSQGDDVTSEDNAAVLDRINVMENELGVLEKLKKTPSWKRNFLYPVAFLFVLVLTALTVFKVIINTLQLIVGLKQLPLSAQSFSLGLSSMSILGVWGACLEVVLILYLMTTSVIGLYSLPGVRNIKPRTGDSPTSHIIYNCALILILSSALPLLSRILGISNFDLLGNFGKIEWLGNFYIVFLYNVIFSVASTLCLVNKFTSAIRQELARRLKQAFRFRPIHSYCNPYSYERSKSPSSSPFSSQQNTPVKTKSPPAHASNGICTETETKKTI